MGIARNIENPTSAVFNQNAKATVVSVHRVTSVEIVSDHWWHFTSDCLVIVIAVDVSSYRGPVDRPLDKSAC